MFNRFREMMRQAPVPSRKPVTDESESEAVPRGSFLGEMARTAYQSLIPGAASLEDASPERQALAKTVGGIDDPQPFTQAVGMVNSALASHKDENLPAEKQRAYAEAIRQVQSGAMSNAGAFSQSASDWAKLFIQTHKPEAAVGAVFNSAGAAMAGAIDANDMKTGAAFRRS
ncbi:hypothetical protein U6010_11000 [Pseudomonas aeruginosa]|uniref:hypothetical protein n=1 Tax=Pseudomonas aeruginosa TaxID=287 RepID=UPI002ADDBDBD|nr:hypothetical protein [Pseudomonas aeruginosa]MEA0988968.1 hypothetical protein [Pseudomonas aeruginosa]